jgi:exopolysaccharide biosynthesis operon protein EpsL
MGEVNRNIRRLLVIVGLVPCAHALADQQDVFNVYAQSGYTHDSNLYRLDDGVNPSIDGETSRSDNILGITAGLRLDKPISQQRFRLDASASRNIYANYDFLSHSTFQYDGAWNWHLTPRISGILSLARSEALNGFDNYRTYDVQSMRTTYTNRFEADYWLRSNWHSLVGLVHDKRTNTESYQQESDNRSLGWNVGVKYDRGTGRSLTIRYIQRDGDYLNRPVDYINYLDDAYTQRDYEFTLAYPINDKTRLEGVVAYVDRTHPNIDERDYDGWRGQVGLDWKLSGKIGLKAEVHRRTEPWQDSESSYAITTGLSVGPQWAITAKQSLDARVEYDNRQHEGALPISLGPLREDDRMAFSVQWGWEPTRTLNVGASVRWEQRDSNLPGYDYKDTSVGLNARLMF